MGGRKKNGNYARAVESLFGLQRFGVKLGLKNIGILLERLGNPHERFACCHIAGTNGKGTAAAVCHAVLSAHGVTTGLFTSPHLISLRERIRIGFETVPRSFVADWVGEHLSFLLSRRLTFFETVTAMAFDYFRRAGITAAVVEVGLGGRYDATNVIRPAVAAITSIGMDHAKYLGNSLQAIAAEKAGIVKPGVPLLCAEKNRKALAVIEATCRRAGSPLVLLEQAIRLRKVHHVPGGITFDCRGPAFELEQAKVALYGRHQARNVALGLLAAEAMLKELGIPVEGDKAAAALAALRCPGRFQHCYSTGGVELILDVAHNPPAARKLVEVFRRLYGRERRAVVVAGLGSYKRCAGFFRPLLAIAEEFVLPQVDFGRAETGGGQLDPESLERYLRSQGARARTSRSMADAMAQAQELAGRHDSPVLITGSFHTVGEAMRGLGLTA